MTTIINNVTLQSFKIINQIMQNDLLHLATQNSSIDMLMLAIFVETKKSILKFISK